MLCERTRGLVMFATLAGVRARSVLSFVESEAFVFPRPVTKKTEEPEAFLSSVCSLQSSLFVVGLSRFSARLGPHLAGAHAPRTRGNPLTPSRGFLFVYRFVSVCLGPLFGFGFFLSPARDVSAWRFRGWKGSVAGCCISVHPEFDREAIRSVFKLFFVFTARNEC